MNTDLLASATPTITYAPPEGIFNYIWVIIALPAIGAFILLTLGKARKACSGKPQCIIAQTVKGKGVSFMEHQLDWHGKAPNDEQYQKAREELEGAIV